MAETLPLDLAVQGVIEFESLPWTLGPHIDVYGNIWGVVNCVPLNKKEALIQALPVNGLYEYYSNKIFTNKKKIKTLVPYKAIVIGIK